jgi:xanthine dehydrogenase iron-sulfur cluster and FAD-binding subunit A
MSISAILAAGIAAVVAAATFGIYLMVRALASAARRAGRQEAALQQQEKTLETINRAHRVDEAVRGNSDPAWLERVRRKYRRP